MTVFIAAAVCAVLTALGLAQAVASWHAARSYARTTPPQLDRAPGVTLLKPLYGDEPLLEEALATCFQQDFPTYQIVFGVQDPADPALAVVRRLQTRFPRQDVAVVIDRARHGANGKVSNLINMFPAARHDIVVIADSDLHVRPDYLARVASELCVDGCGLVTTPYVGRPAFRGLTGLLGASQINHCFLPGALLARALGRQDCLGATMALRRETLERIGGLAALVDHLADDNVLGRLVRAQGLSVRLATAIPATTVPETDVSALWRHEIRWARTIRALVPVAFAASALQFPLFWAGLAVLATGGAWWAVTGFALAWAVRATAARGIDRALRPLLGGLAFDSPVWLLPVRDSLSVAVMVASYASARVEWRGHALEADDGVSAAAPTAFPSQYGTSAHAATAYAAKEGLIPR